MDPQDPAGPWRAVLVASTPWRLAGLGWRGGGSVSIDVNEKERVSPGNTDHEPADQTCELKGSLGDVSEGAGLGGCKLPRTTERAILGKGRH